jgi:mevalonate kinase
MASAAVASERPSVPAGSKGVALAKLSFETRACGKWILAGEHTVLRGGRALVFPFHEMSMGLQWLESHTPLKVEFSGERGQELALIFYGVLEEALKRLGRERQDLHGQLNIESNMRLGAGLGASAALCAGVSKFLSNLGYLPNEDIENFSRQLENLFHGESSGVDIAVALRQKPLVFSRKEGFSDLQVSWKPHWYLSYSGKRGVTAECVKKVKDLWESNPGLAQKIDQEMLSAVELALEALTLNETKGLPMLAKSMDNARDAFFQWKLADGPLGQHINDVLARGALAAKPTGSGGGGFVLSLWPKPIQAHDLLPI